MLTVKVFQKDTHKIIKAKQGTNLLNLLQEHNLLLYSPCGEKDFVVNVELRLWKRTLSLPGYFRGGFSSRNTRVFY